MTSKIYNTDGLELLARLPDDNAQLIYLDPSWYDHYHSTRMEEGVSLRDYLQFLGDIIKQSRRVLSASGFVVFHPDPSLTGNIRLILDQIFDRSHFRYEAILPISTITNSHAPRVQHESLLYYCKSDESLPKHPFRQLTQGEILQRFPKQDSRGHYRHVTLIINSRGRPRYSWRGVLPPAGMTWRFSVEKMEALFDEGLIVLSETDALPHMKQYASENASVKIGSVWNDISPFLKVSERTGFMSQQPIAVLERIIDMTSEPDDLIIDPFFGSGTALLAAEKKGRRWIGGDLSPEAIEITTKRFEEDLGLQPDLNFQIASTETLLADYPVANKVRTDLYLGLDDVTSSLRIMEDLESNIVYDVFISHAREDKKDFVSPLAVALKERGFRVWYDEFTLKIGDSLQNSIDKGLSESRYGIVVLSSSFFSKAWTQYELNGLTAREIDQGKVILPIWHKVSKDEVLKFSPTLADKVALNSSLHSIEEIVAQLEEVLGTT